MKIKFGEYKIWTCGSHFMYFDSLAKSCFKPDSANSPWNQMADDEDLATPHVETIGVTNSFQDCPLPFRVNHPMKFWSGWRISQSRHLVPKTSALLLSYTPNRWGRIWTFDVSNVRVLQTPDFDQLVIPNVKIIY